LIPPKIRFNDHIHKGFLGPAVPLEDFRKCNEMDVIRNSERIFRRLLIFHHPPRPIPFETAMLFGGSDLLRP
jgi:hypothetical protein